MIAQILHIHLNLTGFFQFLLCRALRQSLLSEYLIVL